MFRLPKLNDSSEWQVVLDTNYENESQPKGCFHSDENYPLAGRAMVLLVQKEPSKKE